LAIDLEDQILFSQTGPQAHRDLFGQIAEVEDALIGVVSI
jgi:hypothetical protein